MENGKKAGDIFTKRENSIPVRVLYYKELPIITKGSLSSKGDENIESIILHMHGGGFAVHSSRSSQGFTRKWANELKIPIFSIDYRMAPEHLHPTAAYDCLRVYKFLNEHLFTFMRINPKNIYIAGDSAGSTLTCSLTALILKENLPKPKGLFLVYPGLDLRNIYYSSRRFIFNDPMIWPTVAEVFVNSYYPRE